MAQRQRLAKQAVARGEIALREFNAAMHDGHMDAGERARHIRRLREWFVVSKAADASQALGHALERGIGDVEYLRLLVTGYQQIVDELPDDLAA